MISVKRKKPRLDFDSLMDKLINNPSDAEFEIFGGIKTEKAKVASAIRGRGDFEQLNSFIDKNNRMPDIDSDNHDERKMARRMNAYALNPKEFDALKGHDKYGLIDKTRYIKPIHKPVSIIEYELEEVALQRLRLEDVLLDETVLNEMALEQISLEDVLSDETLLDEDEVVLAETELEEVLLIEPVVMTTTVETNIEIETKSLQPIILGLLHQFKPYSISKSQPREVITSSIASQEGLVVIKPTTPTIPTTNNPGACPIISAGLYKDASCSDISYIEKCMAGTDIISSAEVDKLTGSLNTDIEVTDDLEVEVNVDVIALPQVSTEQVVYLCVGDDYEDNNVPNTDDYEDNSVSNTDDYEDNSVPNTDDYEDNSVSNTDDYEDNSVPNTDDYEDNSVSNTDDYEDNSVRDKEGSNEQIKGESSNNNEYSLAQDSNSSVEYRDRNSHSKDYYLCVGEGSDDYEDNSVSNTDDYEDNSVSNTDDYEDNSVSNTDAADSFNEQQVEYEYPLNSGSCFYQTPIIKNSDEIKSKEESSHTVVGNNDTGSNNELEAKAVESAPTIASIKEKPEISVSDVDKPLASTYEPRRQAVSIGTEFDDSTSENELVLTAQEGMQPVNKKDTRKDIAPSNPESAGIEKKVRTIDEILEADDGFLASLCAAEEKYFDMTPKDSDADSRTTPDEVGKQTPCNNFYMYEPKLKELHAKLKSKECKTVPFTSKNIKKGDAFVLNGMVGFIESIGEYRETAGGNYDPRLRLVFDNGTESNILLRSLSRALYMDKTSRLIVRSADDFTDFDNHDAVNKVRTGQVYIVRSLSGNPKLRQIRDLYKIGFTKNTVEERTSNASRDVSFLEAPVEVITKIECYDLDPRGLEGCIHDFLHYQRVNISLTSKNGIVYKPKEWFSININDAKKIVAYIIDGSIIKYKMDNTTNSLVKR